MIGKKNVVFGFIFLLLTASLGPYMVTVVYPDVTAAALDKQASVGELQLMASSDFEQDLEPMSAEAIAKANTAGILAINTHLNQSSVLDEIKGGPHAHGNLEALLNIAVGVVLCFLSVSAVFKQLISWAFILGTVLHSGLLYLVVMFQLPWAGQLLGLGIGPVLLLLGLIMAGIATAIGFQGKLADN
jgi:hypothetical protein